MNMLTDTQEKILELKVGALVLEYDFENVKKALEKWSPESLAKKKNIYTQSFSFEQFNSDAFNLP